MHNTQVLISIPISLLFIMLPSPLELSQGIVRPAVNASTIDIFYNSIIPISTLFNFAVENFVKVSRPHTGNNVPRYEPF